MGTMALVSPKTGMKIKLCSLKYAPNTATAVEVKPTRIWFMVKFMTEPMATMTMEGIPTDKMGLRTSQCSRIDCRERVTSGFLRRWNRRARKNATIWPMTVATAAPATPMAGIPKPPKINSGSNIMFNTAPMPWVIMVYMVRPVAWRRRSNRISPKRPKENRVQICKY